MVTKSLLSKPANSKGKRNGRKSEQRRPLPPLKPAPKLPKLKVALYRDGKFSRIEEFDDPRAKFIQYYTQMSGQFGYSAKPISDAFEVLLQPAEPRPSRKPHVVASFGTKDEADQFVASFNVENEAVDLVVREGGDA